MFVGKTRMLRLLALLLIAPAVSVLAGTWQEVPEENQGAGWRPVLCTDGNGWQPCEKPNVYQCFIYMTITGFPQPHPAVIGDTFAIYGNTAGQPNTYRWTLAWYPLQFNKVDKPYVTHNGYTYYAVDGAGKIFTNGIPVPEQMNGQASGIFPICRSDIHGPNPYN